MAGELPRQIRSGAGCTIIAVITSPNTPSLPAQHLTRTGFFGRWCDHLDRRIRCFSYRDDLAPAGVTYLARQVVLRAQRRLQAPNAVRGLPELGRHQSGKRAGAAVDPAPRCAARPGPLHSGGGGGCRGTHPLILPDTADPCRPPSPPALLS